MMKHSKATLSNDFKPRLSSVTGLRHKPVTSNHQTETVSHAVMLESASTRHVQPIDSMHHSGCNTDLISIFPRWEKSLEVITKSNGFSSTCACVSSGLACDFLSLENNRKTKDVFHAPSFSISFGLCKHYLDLSQIFSTHHTTSLKQCYLFGNISLMMEINLPMSGILCWKCLDYFLVVTMLLGNLKFNYFRYWYFE